MNLIYIIGNAIGYFDKKNYLIEINGFIIDITEQKNLEDQLLKAQKMETL